MVALAPLVEYTAAADVLIAEDGTPYIAIEEHRDHGVETLTAQGGRARVQGEVICGCGAAFALGGLRRAPLEYVAPVPEEAWDDEHENAVTIPIRPPRGRGC